MILLANFLQAAATILHVVLRIYMFIILFRVILTWIRIPSLYQVTVILYHLTEPVLKPIRKYVPPYKMGGLDLFRSMRNKSSCSRHISRTRSEINNTQVASPPLMLGWGGLASTRE
jgi:YggT family protein